MKSIMRLPVLIFTLIAAIVPALGQQDAAHPDFSGTWKLNPKRSGLSAKSPLAAETMVITCNGLSIEMRHASVIDGHEIVQTYIADGQPRTAKETPQVEIESKAFWEKSSLVVVQTTHQSIVPSTPGTRPVVMTSRWTLSKDGSTLRSEISTNFGYPHSYVYDKH
jgi:hypothetical protein